MCFVCKNWSWNWSCVPAKKCIVMTKLRQIIRAQQQTTTRRRYSSTKYETQRIVKHSILKQDYFLIIKNKYRSRCKLTVKVKTKNWGYLDITFGAQNTKIERDKISNYNLRSNNRRLKAAQTSRRYLELLSKKGTCIMVFLLLLVRVSVFHSLLNHHYHHQVCRCFKVFGSFCSVTDFNLRWIVCWILWIVG